MRTSVPGQVQKAQADGAWQKGPVAWESCGTMQDWVAKGYDVHYVFQYALDLHGSFVNNKSAKLPAGDQNRKEVEWLLSTLGYRLVLRSLSHPKSVAAGAALPLSMSWDNLGVAPPYHPFGLQVRLTPPPGSGAAPVVLKSSADVRKWLPGKTQVDESITLPSPMTWQLAVGITGTPGVPMLRLAIDGRDAEGWYPLSRRPSAPALPLQRATAAGSGQCVRLEREATRGRAGARCRLGLHGGNDVKQNQICPKCQGRKLWCIERLEAKDPSVAVGGGLPLMLAVTRQSTPPTKPKGFWGDGSEVQDIGQVDAWVCATCGYTELWSSGHQQLVHNPQRGIHFVDASQPQAAR